MNKNSAKVALAAGALAFAAYTAYAEQVTISTYYPSPYGSYVTLTTTTGATFATSSGVVGIGPSAATSHMLNVAGGANITGASSFGNTLSVGSTLTVTGASTLNSASVTNGLAVGGLTSTSAAGLQLNDGATSGLFQFDCDGSNNCYAVYA